MNKCEICGRELEDNEVCECVNKNGNNKESVNAAENETAGKSAAGAVAEETDKTEKKTAEADKTAVNESTGEAVSESVTVSNESDISDFPVNDEQNMNDYFKFTIDKDKVAGAVQSAKEVLSDNKKYNESECIVNAADGEFEEGLKIVDNCVVGAEEETPVKQYDFAYMKTPFLKKAYGRLQVTTKRIIYRAAGKSISGPVLVEKEFDIKEIGGVEIKSDYRFSIIQYIISLFITYFITMCCVFPAYIWLRGNHETNAIPILLMIVYAIAEIYMMIFVKKRRRVKSAFAFAIGVISFLLMTKGMLTGGAKNGFLMFFTGAGCLYSLIMSIFAGIVDDLQLVIKVNGASEAFEVARKLFHDERSGFWFVKPWKDTEIAIRELGAMVDDFKRLSTDKALEKWKDN